MTLAEQAVRRIELARATGATPRHWIVTSAAEVQLVADADAWSDDRASLHRIPVERGEPRSKYGLDLVVAPRVVASVFDGGAA